MPRRPKPTALKLIEGNPGRRPLNLNEPQARQGEPDLPSFLEPEAKREWKRLCIELDAMGLLQTANRGVMAQYCQHWARWRQAEMMLSKHGIVVQLPDGRVQMHPAVRVSANAAMNLHKAQIELGLTPASRAKLTTPGKPLDELDALLG